MEISIQKNIPFLRCLIRFDCDKYNFLIFSRYTAICHPLRPSLQSGKRKTIWIIATIWAVCIVPSALWLIYAKVENFYSIMFNNF